MNIFTIDVPLCKDFGRILKKMNKKVTFLEDPLNQSHLFEDSSDLMKSLFILPLHISKDSWQQTSLFALAESHEIPILFIYKRTLGMDPPQTLPEKTFYETMAVPADSVEVRIKLRSLKNISMQLFSAKLKGQELEKIHQKSARSLRIAKGIQLSSLPLSINNEDIEIKGLFQPSSDLSGDLFYWAEVDDSIYGFIMIDVFGKGIHTALINMSIRALMPDLIKRVKDPIYITEELGKHIRDLFQGVNRQNKKHARITAFIAYVNTKDRLIEYVNYGLPSAFLYSPCTNQILNLNEGATPSGPIPELPIKKVVFHYEPGSRFIIYTDELSKTPTPSAIDRSDNIEREFIENVHLDTNDLLQKLLVSRMRHSVINDDICIIAGTLF
ncbi:PP2C family protein-serine/threonine phosphatase [Peribacillus castrilensis]|uniref:Response regulator n=1 Tax=Peribacillus simplex TaxID=1478 RepID=A0AAN2PBC9_9BACI|nr:MULTISPECIES: PP2C family protein-serine/threonine phosphatase [Bacillaceae]MCP1097104.1 serine/threonine-protein phosphatase [Bacillaceae bacterium OS4b]MBD8590493.1 serine/threonine-protein phosphatase [Peribacillus simplex]MCF7620376.1 serine/threonine-protein phosphatase [Peribacillus frigoritolerans]MCP1151123.1 serine/threonine-protein phosphatase [Peribacillus frigoritolerans]MCT1391577.1 serine/threonine-protein phosphatase [Peribacillus frigoritolerans]